MRRRVAPIGALLLSLGCAPPQAAAPAPAPAVTAAPVVEQAGPITLNLCAGAGAREQDRAWKTPLLTSTARLLDGALPRDATFKLRVGECPAAFRVGTCYASPGFLACREEFLARLLQAAAWGGALSAVALRSTPDARAWYGTMAKIGGGDLFELVSAGTDALPALAHQWEAEGTWKADEIVAAQALVERIRALESNGGAASSPEETLAEAIYLTTAGHLVSFVLGHELSHYASDRCFFADASIVEGEGRIDALRSLQEPGGPLCASIPVQGAVMTMALHPEELLADRCAVRGMARLERRTFRGTWGDPAAGTPRAAMGFVARRLVVDVLSWFLAYGPTSRGRADYGQDGNPAAIRASLLPGYLYPQHRLALVAAELSRHVRPQAGLPLLCEDAGRVFVLQTRASISVCQPGKLAAIRAAEQQLAGPLGAYVPPGVTQLWQTGQWDQDQSFRCAGPP